LDLLAALGSAWLLYRLLRHYAVSPALSLLAVGWWAVLPLGLRWALYYPVLPDTLGFFLLLALMVCALEGRFVLFGGVLVVAALTRESLIALGPLLWLLQARRRAPVPARVALSARGAAHPRDVLRSPVRVAATSRRVPPPGAPLGVLHRHVLRRRAGRRPRRRSLPLRSRARARSLRFPYRAFVAMAVRLARRGADGAPPRGRALLMAGRHERGRISPVHRVGDERRSHGRARLLLRRPRAWGDRDRSA